MEKTKRKYIELILGIILLIPPILSVLAFSLQIFNISIFRGFYNKGVGQAVVWVGNVTILESRGAGHSSSLPLYFDLMAIAGAYLISHSTTETKQ